MGEVDASYKRLYEGSGHDTDESHGGSDGVGGFSEYWGWKAILHQITEGSLIEQDYILENLNWIGFLNELAFRKDLAENERAIIERHTKAVSK